MSGSPEKIAKLRYQASIQYWAIIGTPVNSIYIMRFAGVPDDGPLIVVLESSLPSSAKKIVKVGPPLTKLSGSAHESH